MASYKSIRGILLARRRASYFSLSLAGIVFIALLAGCRDGGAPPPEITSSSPLPGATVGQEYEVTLEARYGQPPLAWSGSPPADLRLESDSGRITGKPGAEGSFPFEVTVKDSADRSNTKSFELSITPAADVPLAITTTSPLRSAVVGEEGYEQQLKATRRGQLTWSSSDLADDFTLDPAQGILTATPKRDGAKGTLDRVGTFTFDVSVTDEEKHCSAKRFQLTVGLYIVTRKLQDATQGRDYEARVEVKGGIPPLKWSLATGAALPGGLNLDGQTGEITGNPTSASATPSAFKVTVTDSAIPEAQSDTQSILILVREPG